MSPDSALDAAAAAVCASLAIAPLIRKWRSVASWSFSAGMAVLCAKSVFVGLALSSATVAGMLSWQRCVLLSESLLPAAWLCFSFTYSRGNAREFLARWKELLIGALVIPVGLAVFFFPDLLIQGQTETGEPWIALGFPGKILTGLILLATVLILANLEKTFRAAIGMMRWRIKFLVLGLGVIFGTRIYVSSQALLFSGQTPALSQLQSSALILGCALIAIGYLRSGFAEIDLYPSHAMIQGSVTILIAAGYLIVVGILAQVVVAIGGIQYFRVQAFLVLLGIVGLALFLLSDQMRQRRRRFVSRHFRRPQHDFRKVWTLFTERTSSQFDEEGLGSAVAKLISETFDVLSVAIWTIKPEEERLVLVASTAQTRTGEVPRTISTAGMPLFAPGPSARPFDLDSLDDSWATQMRERNPRQFEHGGHRVTVPLLAGERVMGLAVTSDRVGGLSYTEEEADLLVCIGDQLAASLLNLRLAEENLRAKEMETFQTLSAFFVHDLKNAASGLNLTLQNLRKHFDVPEFRADALRSIASTSERINSLIERLSRMRSKLEIRPTELDLNALVSETLKNFAAADVAVESMLSPLPPLLADREQLQSVIQNLLLNARDALNGGGRIEVTTRQEKDLAVLAVADNGCGMSEEFIRRSLFRPFQTTKQKGIGIGMFQAQAIVQAHRGSIRVESEPEKGSTFRVLLPLPSSRS